jgi:hypothetical protein
MIQPIFVKVLGKELRNNFHDAKFKKEFVGIQGVLVILLNICL